MHACMTRRTSLHAVKNGRHFTQSAGLFATRPVAEAPRDEYFVAEAPRDEYFHFARLLRHEAFLRFDCDPGAVFSGETYEYGFREGGRMEIPGVNLLDLRVRIVIFLD